MEYLVNDLQLTENFKLSEFACNDGSKEIKLDMALVNKLQQLRYLVERPIKVVSGYRNPEYNKLVGGASKSQHLLGKAADIKISGYKPKDLVKYAKSVGFNGIGVYDSFLHVDVRDTDAYWEG
jgi:zinc D-Ala-D-Ala carboxypeptidase